MKTQFGAYAGWGADDSYLGYIRLKPGVFPKQINQKIPALLPKYIDVERERNKVLRWSFISSRSRRYIRKVPR